MTDNKIWLPRLLHWPVDITSAFVLVTVGLPIHAQDNDGAQDAIGG